MANNPQAQNLPTIRFTKRVGQAPLKNMIQGVIESTLGVLAHDIDMSGRTLNVVLTRANTGSTRGHIRISAKTCEETGDRVQNLDVMELMLNLGPMRNARDEGDLIKTLMHETIHYVQYQSGIMSETLDGRRWITSLERHTSVRIEPTSTGRPLLRHREANSPTGGRPCGDSRPCSTRTRRIQPPDTSQHLKNAKHGRRFLASLTNYTRKPSRLAGIQPARHTRSPHESSSEESNSSDEGGRVKTFIGAAVMGVTADPYVQSVA